MHMSDTRSEATEDEIAVCAYFIWEQEGKPLGRALDHWLQAELQLAASLWYEFPLVSAGADIGRPAWPRKLTKSCRWRSATFLSIATESPFKALATRNTVNRSVALR